MLVLNFSNFRIISYFTFFPQVSGKLGAFLINRERSFKHVLNFPKFCKISYFTFFAPLFFTGQRHRVPRRPRVCGFGLAERVGLARQPDPIRERDSFLRAVGFGAAEPEGEQDCDPGGRHVRRNDLAVHVGREGERVGEGGRSPRYTDLGKLEKCQLPSYDGR